MAMENDYYKRANGAQAQYGNLRREKTPTELEVDKDMAVAITTNSAGSNGDGAAGAKENGSGNVAGSSVGVRSAYERAVDEQNRLLMEQQRLAEQQRKAALDATIKANNKAANKSLREAYIANMLSKRNLPQQLKALGVSGGASETTLSDLENTYMNNRFGIEEQRNEANARARAAYDAGVAGDYSQYLAKAFELQGGYADALAKMGAASASGSKATPRLTGYSARAVGDDNNEAVVSHLTRQYIKEGWSRDQIEKMLRQQGLLA